VDVLVTVGEEGDQDFDFGTGIPPSSTSKIAFLTMLGVSG
jgi:hypothetical protein